jgi:hypothetical protein
VWLAVALELAAEGERNARLFQRIEAARDIQSNEAVEPEMPTPAPLSGRQGVEIAERSPTHPRSLNIATRKPYWSEASSARVIQNALPLCAVSAL